MLRNSILATLISSSSLFGALSCNDTGDILSYNGHYYAITAQKMDFFTAKAAAEASGGYLAIPESQSENDFLQPLVPSNSAVWIGIYDKGIQMSGTTSRFSTIKDQAISYSNWEYGQPDNAVLEGDIMNGQQLISPLGEHWGAMRHTGQWIDAGNHAQSYNPVKFQAIYEFDTKPECTVSNDAETQLVDPSSGLWCTDGITFGKCIATTEYIAKTGSSYTYPAINNFEFKTINIGLSFSWQPPNITTTVVNTLTFWDAHFSCGADWELDFKFTIDKSSGNLNLDILTDRCGYFLSYDWNTGKATGHNPNSITWQEDQHVGPTFVINKNTNGTVSLYKNGIETDYIEWLVGNSDGSNFDDSWTSGNKMSIKKNSTCPNGGTLSGSTCTVNTLACPTGYTETTGAETAKGECKKDLPPSCSIGSYSCTTTTQENLDTTVGATDGNNAGWRADGTCAGQINIFSGKDYRCRSDDMFFGLTGGGCCDKDKVGFGLVQCKAEEKLLAKRAKSNLCHEVGEYCSKKISLGFTKICVQHKKSSCCFGDILSRIINEQGRAQLGKTWGSPSSPQCRGFTPEEFQKIDFSKVNLSEFINTLTPPNTSGISNNVSESIINKFK